MAPKIAYLGPPGTFTEAALLKTPSIKDADLFSKPSVYEAITAVQEGECARAFVPIENSLEGSVNATLDLLANESTDLVITDEVTHPISHCLIGGATIALSEITHVSSHPQAIAQCARFLHQNLLQAEIVPSSSTAGAVAELAGGPHTHVAIGTTRAAELNQATVLQQNIQDSDYNVTRFVWLAPPSMAVAPSAPAKTSVVFSEPAEDQAGWLVGCLSEFAFRGVNLTKIESRPRKQQLGTYMFFCDLDGPAHSQPIAAALDALREKAALVKVLGSYPKASKSNKPKALAFDG